ncbi:Alpha/beta hydrolase family protein [Polystyrenella longa]|uniref:Alpha/beta hydrolase family protein n=1 Tax=Polystyrenella longa TaxID=2528007 RepID=A0A518CME8_9PLAN|nr:alpha/beta hydrolase-fold protein [Polystyrenella longa]QDU80402.1 Alpha/beta hydrolase family protein [Polystyrenella longa]
MSWCSRVMVCRWKVWLLVLLLCLVLVPLQQAVAEPGFPPDSVFKLKTFEDQRGVHKYSLFLPEGYTDSKKWPVVLFLHGAGERGTDGASPTRVGLGAALQERPENYPFIAVFPQVEDTTGRYLEGWVAESSDGKKAIQILDAVINEYSVDRDHQILTGWSMGGYGVWSLAAATPDRWSAIMPLSGGGDPEWAAKLSNTPIWNVHGEHDFVVLPEESRKMEAAFKALKENHQTYFSYITNGAHDIWKNVYGYTGVVKWLLNPVPENRVDLTLAEALIKTLPAPFVPALELHRAAKIRVGNEALEMFSYAVPSRIPTDMLSGQLENIQTTTEVEGYAFNVVFGGVSYQAQLKRVLLQTTPDKLLSIKLGFERIALTLGNTAVQGRRHSANAGPIQVTLGTREPLWLDIRVEPYLESGRIKLRNRGANLILDHNNMQVSLPAGITVEGLGMTRERVSRGLVNGLYNSRGRFQQEIQQLAPRIVRELEKRLDLNEIVKDSSSVWPLPVYAPRIKMRPNSISVDSNGFSLGLDFLVASYVDHEPSESPRIVENEDNLEVGTGPALEIVLATNTMTEAMRLMIEEGISFVDVEDIPGTAFDRWADRAFWKQILADEGKPFPDAHTRVRMSINAPLEFGPHVDASIDPALTVAENVTAGEAELLSVSHSRLALTDVRLTLMTKDPKRFSQRWKPCCTLQFDLSQQFDFTFVKPSHTQREIRVGLSDPMQVTVKLVSEDGKQSPLASEEKAILEFRTAMQNWLGKATRQSMAVPDLDMESAGLRASRLALHKDQLVVDFETPVVRVINTSKEQQRYQTRGPYSSWSEDWVLEPGKTHLFTVPYPMLYRRNAGEVQELYTLPLGADAEFRDVAGVNPESQVGRLFLKQRQVVQDPTDDKEQMTTSGPDLGQAQ